MDAAGQPVRKQNLNGDVRKMEYRFTTLLGSHDDDVGKVFVFRDISPRKGAEVGD